MLHIAGSLPGAAQSPSCSTRACFAPSARQALTDWMRVPSAIMAQTGLRTSGHLGPFGTAAAAGDAPKTSASTRSTAFMFVFPFRAPPRILYRSRDLHSREPQRAPLVSSPPPDLAGRHRAGGVRAGLPLRRHGEGGDGLAVRPIAAPSGCLDSASQGAALPEPRDGAPGQHGAQAFAIPQ